MSDSNELIGSAGLQWNDNVEQMFVRMCDQAKCFEWMHSESYDEFFRKAQRLTILLTIVGSLGGLSNVIAGGDSIGSFQLSWLFGSVTILISMLTMLQEKLGYSTMAGEFKQYATMWGIVRRNIEEELILPPTSRVNCASFLTYIRKSYNQVYNEGTPKIPHHIKLQCYEKYKDIPDFDIPDVCGQIEHTKVYIDNLQEMTVHIPNNIFSNNISNNTINNTNSMTVTEKTPLIQ